MTALCDEALSCNNPTPRRPVAGRRFFNISLIYEGQYLCKTWHLQIFPLVRVRQFEKLDLVMYLLLGLIKVNIAIASHDIFKRSVVFWDLFQKLFGDSYPSKFLLFCTEIYLALMLPIFKSLLRELYERLLQRYQRISTYT
jgi:hypothetical protein